jgi:hypothetical protein
MTSWRNKFTAVLAIASFLLSFTVCEVACASGDDDAGDTKTVQHHCIGQCGCHGVTIPSTDVTQSPLVIEDRDLVPPVVNDNSRLVPASIFNPPRA